MAIDFDGTCVSHEFPNVGNEIGSIPVIKELIKNGHKIIIFTMRSNKKEGIVPSDDKYISDKFDNYLDQAVKWFNDNDIPLFGVNQNPESVLWTDSPKPYAHLYIDDSALGCPLKTDKKISEKPFADWGKIREYLIDNNIIQ